MSDYGADLPLWDAEGLVDPDAVELSPALRQALLDWQAAFATGFHHDHGWTSGAARDGYCHAASALHRWVEAELGLVVELDLWPCEVR